MSTMDAPHQTISKTVGLAVFGADALSSIAYAPQETLVILAAAGTQAFHYAFPISLIITVLLAIVTISYQQTVRAYPNGGGAYIVTRDNLGVLPAQVAGAALLTDYILLAAVVTSSGVAQIISAYPILFPYRVLLSISVLVVIMVANLRGVKEAGALFALPTYFFLGMTVLAVAVGFFRYLTGTLGVVADPPLLETIRAAQPVTLFLLLRAFSNGTTALTGVECISDGVTAFKEPRARNASQTMIWMSATLGVLFVGITFLIGKIGVVPSEAETVISQLARTVFAGRGPLYLATIASTTIILILATNTAFADFPRLTAIIANEGFLPRYFTYRGSRLVFSYGVVALTFIAGLLIFAFKASVTALIPLWAVGVFISFTLSQAGMAARWWKVGHLAPGQSAPGIPSVLDSGRGWKWKLAINGFGAICTAVVTLIFAITKFRDGAWIIVILLPAVVAVFFAIHSHYLNLAKGLSLNNFGMPRRTQRHRVIVPISGVHRGALVAIDYARSLSADITAVYISVDSTEAQKLRHLWEWWGDGVRLVIIDSPYRAFLEPFLAYIDGLGDQLRLNERLTIVVPQFVPKHWWHNLLHSQTALWLRFALLQKKGIVIIEVPYLEQEGVGDASLPPGVS